MDLAKLNRNILALLEQHAQVDANAILPLVLDSAPNEEERDALESEGGIPATEMTVST